MPFSTQFYPPGQMYAQPQPSQQMFPQQMFAPYQQPTMQALQPPRPTAMGSASEVEPSEKEDEEDDDDDEDDEEASIFLCKLVMNWEGVTFFWCEIFDVCIFLV